MKRVWLIIFPVVLVLILTAGACAKPTTPTGPIKIGTLMALTGFYAYFDPMILDGVEMRFDEAGWAVAGRPIEMIVEDYATDPAVTLDKAKKLVELDKVDFLLGPLFSEAAMAVAPYFAEQNIPDIAFMQHPWEISGASAGWVITPYQTSSPSPHVMARYLYEAGLRTVTILASEHVFSYDTMDWFKKGFESSGGKVLQEQYAPMGTADFAPYIVGMEMADVVVIWAPGPDAERFMTQFEELGLRGKMLVAFPTESGLVPIEVFEGMMLATPYVPAIDTQLNKEFVTAFESKYGRQPMGMESSGYETASIALAALEATNGDTTPETLRQTILELDVTLPSGNVSFTPSGFGIRSVFINKCVVIDGQAQWEVITAYPNIKPLEE